MYTQADTRERCIESAQAVYDRLMMRTPFESALPFETLVLLARNEKGDIDKEKAKELIKLIRPERDGTVGILEFVKSIDAVYKQLRLLSANISNSSQLDKAVEAIINVFYYVFLGCVVLIVFGQNPSAIFLSFSSVALGFAFMFGASASKYFEVRMMQGLDSNHLIQIKVAFEYPAVSHISFLPYRVYFLYWYRDPTVSDS